MLISKVRPSMKYLESIYKKLQSCGNIQVIENMEDERELLFRLELSKIMEKHLKNTAARKGKRFRSAFTTEQVNYLEQEFKKFPYIGNAQRREVANILNIPERAVKIWFQNRRMKEKNNGLNKEQEIDERINQKNVEFANDQLSNTSVSTSVNDQRLNQLKSVTSLEDAPIQNNICKRVTCDETVAFIRPPELKFHREVSPDFDRASTSNSSNTLPQNFNNNLKQYHKSSAEFSIDLYKKYRASLVNTNNQYNKGVSTNSHTPKNEQSVLNVQNRPEDLSYKSTKSTEAESQQKNVNPNELGYQPVYVANYPPYLSAGNILWKPVNIMPMMPTGTSVVTVPSGTPGSSTANLDQRELKQCHCNCHEKTDPVISETNQNSQSQSQFILTALPLQIQPTFQ